MKKMTKCPVCGAKNTDSTYTLHSQPIKNWRAHIRKIAEREIFLKSLIGDNRKTPHFDYYKKNVVLINTEQITVKL